MKENQVGLGKQEGLAKYLSPIDVWAIAFGCIVGWGAFVMPGTTFLPLAGPLGSVAALIIGAVLMLIIGRNYSYLMEKRPGAGGVYSYTKEAFGRDHAFICSWFLSLSYLSIVFLNATALFVLSRTVFGDFFHFGFHYQIAGFEVYFGEIMMSVLALEVFGLIYILKKPLLQFLQTAFAILLFLGVGVMTVAALPHLQASSLWEQSGLTDVPLPAAIITIVLLAPWAFVGFDTASLETAHFNFPVRKSRRIITVSIVSGALIYIALSIISISSVPEGFSSWQEYIANLDLLNGIPSVPTIFSAKSSLGTAGVAIVSMTALSAIFTGIIAAYRASTRVLSNMAVDMIVPKRFLGTTECILFIMIISISVSFLGRNALVWFVDLTSLGAIIGFGYTSASAFRIARKDKNSFIAVTGAIGTVISVIFALVHLISRIGYIETMQTQSFFMLALWCLLGFVFYWRTIRKSELSDFNGVVTSSTILFCLLLFSIIMWFIKSILDENGAVNLQDLIIHNSIIMVIIIIIGVALMLYTQDTLRKRHNRLARDKIRADESSKAKSRFLFNISHDIRTPMNAILGYTHLAREEENLPENVGEYLDKIDLSGKHLLTLINDILDMSLIETGKLVLRNEKADITATARGAYDMFYSQMVEKDIHGEISINVQHQMAEYDTNRLMRVILNLLSNACKFTPKGGNISLTLTERPCEEKNKGIYTLRVKDDGIGMSKEFTASVFEAFERERTSTVSQTQGTGLGMSICKSIIDAMNGTIDIITAPNEGTEFIITVTLPCFADSINKSADKKNKSRSRDFSGKRLLLVDDMAINRQIATRLLEKLGFAVESAENGQAAVDTLTEKGADYYDAVLMDIQMPVMDGYEATRAIRQKSEMYFKCIPIIAVTANASDEDAQKATLAGMNGHISKPISPVELADTLETQLK